MTTHQIPPGHRGTSARSPLARALRRVTGLATEGARRLDRPWQDHALRNASTAAAALRREREEADSAH